MLEGIKASLLFHRLLKRPDIDKAYQMVSPTDAWYGTITAVHRSLARIQACPNEIMEITSHDGLKMKAVYYPCGSEKTMIWVHGYTSHAERESAFPGLFYRSLGFNVLIPYQRGHGLSQGKYISLGALEHRDMMAWIEKVNACHPTGSILLHGLSMGANIVLYMADKELKNVKGIVADAPGDGIAAMLENACRRSHKKNHEQILASMLQRFEREFGISASKFDVQGFVRNSRYPIFLTAGSNEKRDELFDRLRNVNPRDTQVLILPDCDHGNGMYKQTAMYQDALTRFVKNYMEEVTYV